MKHIVFLLALCIITPVLCSAQTKRKLEKTLRLKNDTVNQLNSDIALVNNREFKIETKDEKFKKEIVKLHSIEQLAKATKIAKEIRENFGDVDFYKTHYLCLVEMYRSIMEESSIEGLKGGMYNKDINDLYKKQIGVIIKDIEKFAPNHTTDFLQSLHDLESSIKDYRVAMFELVRVILIIDEKSGSWEKILSQLRGQKETEFIERIPFTKDQLQKYLEGNKTERDSQKESLKRMCKEAFED